MLVAALLASPGQLKGPKELPQNVQLLGLAPLTMKFADPLLNSQQYDPKSFAVNDPEIVRREVTPPRARIDDFKLPTYEPPSKHHVALNVRAGEQEEDTTYSQQEDPSEDGDGSLLPDASFLLPPLQTDEVAPRQDVSCASWAGMPAKVEPMQCGVLWFLHIAKTGGRDIITQLKGQALGPLAKEDGGFVSARELPANWTFVELWYDRQMGASPMKSRRYKDTEAWKTMERALAEEAQPKVFVHDHNNMAGFDDENMFDEVLRPMACALEARGCKLTLATMLREPTSRAKSHVFFEGGAPTPAAGPLSAPALAFGLRRTLRAFALAPHPSRLAPRPSSPTTSPHPSGVTHDNFQQRMSSISNYQTHYLLHNHNFHKIQKLEEADQARAAQMLQHFELVGRTEDHDEFKAFMHTVMGMPNEPNENSDNNKTPDAQKLELTQDEELVARESNLLDTKLFNGLCAADGDSQRKVLPLCTR